MATFIGSVGESRPTGVCRGWDGAIASIPAIEALSYSAAIALDLTYCLEDIRCET
ncbi:MAG: hypothetical protein ACP5D7_18280 [Limnospira sp.]